MNVNLDADVIVESRVKILYNVTKELAKGFGCNDEALNTIEKGISQRQLIEKIVINYLNNDNELVGRITIDIDWEKHRVLANTDEGRNFEIDHDRKQSINKQISTIYPIIVEHTNKLRKAYRIKNIETRYGYTSDVWDDLKKLDEVRRFLGTGPGVDLEWAKSITNDFEIEFAAKQLEELKIRIEHDKSPV